MDEAENKYYVIHLWWLLFKVVTEEGVPGLSEWLGFWYFRYRQWGGHMILVSASPLCSFAVCADYEYPWYMKFTIICVMFV